MEEFKQKVTDELSQKTLHDFISDALDNQSDECCAWFFTHLKGLSVYSQPADPFGLLPKREGDREVTRVQQHAFWLGERTIPMLKRLTTLVCADHVDSNFLISVVDYLMLLSFELAPAYVFGAMLEALTEFDKSYTPAQRVFVRLLGEWLPRHRGVVTQQLRRFVGALVKRGAWGLFAKFMDVVPPETDTDMPIYFHVSSAGLATAVKMIEKYNHRFCIISKDEFLLLRFPSIMRNKRAIFNRRTVLFGSIVASHQNVVTSYWDIICQEFTPFEMLNTHLKYCMQYATPDFIRWFCDHVFKRFPEVKDELVAVHLNSMKDKPKIRMCDHVELTLVARCFGEYSVAFGEKAIELFNKHVRETEGAEIQTYLPSFEMAAKGGHLDYTLWYQSRCLMRPEDQAVCVVSSHDIEITRATFSKEHNQDAIIQWDRGDKFGTHAVFMESLNFVLKSTFGVNLLIRSARNRPMFFASIPNDALQRMMNRRAYVSQPPDLPADLFTGEYATNFEGMLQKLDIAEFFYYDIDFIRNLYEWARFKNHEVIIDGLVERFPDIIRDIEGNAFVDRRKRRRA